MAALARFLPSSDYVFDERSLLFRLPGTNYTVFAPVFAVALYIPLTFLIPRVLPRPIEARLLLAAHNGFLLLVSLTMFFGTLLAIFKNVTQKGATLFDLFCDPKEQYNRGELYYWVWIFHLTKYYELLDTLFIVLKKKDASFVQWFHHAITLLVTWHGLGGGTTYQWAAVITNSFVHIIMYYYFMLTALLPPGTRIWWKPWVTRVQMIQFTVNISGVVAWATLTLMGNNCSGGWQTWWFVLSVNVAFWFLFRDVSQTNAAKDRAAGARPKKD